MSDHKKFVNPKFYKYCLWLGSAALVISGIALIIWKTFNDAIVITALVGISILASSLFYYLGISKPTEDERLRKIGTLAATYSWMTTMVFICFLMVFGYWNGRAFATSELFGIFMVVMVVSLLGFNAFFGYIGDVE